MTAFLTHSQANARPDSKAIILCGYVEMLVNFIDRSSGVDPDDSESLIAKIGVLRVLRLARLLDVMRLGGRNETMQISAVSSISMILV